MKRERRQTKPIHEIHSMLGKKKKNSKEKNKVGKKRMRTGGYRNLYHLYIHVCMLDFVNEKIVKENKIETGIS